MKDTVELFKTLADTTRLRMLQLLSLEELTVTELAQLLNMPQSRVSSQVRRIKGVFALCERSEGRRTYLSLPENLAAEPVLKHYGADIRDSRIGELDRQALARLVAARSEPSDNSGGMGKNDLPGRTWEGFARALLTLIPAQRVLDIGVGEGEMTLLFSRFATELHAVDTDGVRLQRLQARADKQGGSTLRCHQADVRDLPLDDGVIDLVVISQMLHLLEDPRAAVAECARVLAPGGRILILDLLAHDEHWVTEKLGHQRLGFKVSTLKSTLEECGLVGVEAYPVARDAKPPRFVSVLATGRKENA